ncbi:unnamed protein product, partial [Linum tenue]
PLVVFPEQFPVVVPASQRGRGREEKKKESQPAPDPNLIPFVVLAVTFEGSINK